MLKTERDRQMAGALGGFLLVWVLAFATGAFTYDTKRDELFWTVTALVAGAAGWWLGPALFEWLSQAGEATGEKRAPIDDFVQPLSWQNVKEPLLVLFEGLSEAQLREVVKIAAANLTDLRCAHEEHPQGIDGYIRMVLGEVDRRLSPGQPPASFGAAQVLLAVATHCEQIDYGVPELYFALWAKVTGLKPPPRVRFAGGSSSASRP